MILNQCFDIGTVFFVFFIGLIFGMLIERFLIKGMNQKTLQNGYYLLTSGNEKSLVYGCPVGGVYGFAFNLADGGGFVPLHDLTDETIVESVEIKPIEKIRYRKK